ncbi:HesA/MoeB/ThiF family protein [Stygiolobus caldivivus]|uniref:Thiamine biosynthesis protein ThiF n=1 Tax=Stygiolobus caldivivus TaxID=2824673 RepID=A0A8D5U5K5_9CREN|nr:HesA/MoeB/ThiF family protein [Stygiolobus caldivivus]BCU69470.1 thiamine biosynthesis protein ThiF [Stygiolobus caldivivus]
MERYSRQILVLGLGVQQKLTELKVTVVGCGALGSAIAELLARLGVGNIRLIDADIVELSNLHRTRFFTEEDVGRPKALVCKERIGKINSGVNVEAIIDIVDQSNVEELIKGSDYVFDALDSIFYRMVLNDACVKSNIPLIYGGIMGEYASVKLIIPKKTSCLSCFMNYGGDDDRNACETIGTLNTVVDITASLQVQLMINHLMGEEDRNLYYLDLKSLRLDKIRIERNSQCQACSKGEFIYLKLPHQTTCGIVRVKEEVKNSANYGVKIEKVRDGLIICYPDGKCFKKVSR